mmetsp:Transcript_39226/g.59845  ORF Transcript_39226/g.59845 Transcript_39226/m.59845 type:complete len:83 (+) Transcript_39226:2813-3061(+)
MILPWHKSGVLKVQQLIAYIDVIRFALKHCILTFKEDLTTMLGVSELILLVLQDEAKEYDKRAENETNERRHFGVEAPSSCA